MSRPLADDLIAAGFHGVIVPSFAPGTSSVQPADPAPRPARSTATLSSVETVPARNLVLWAWSDQPPCRIRVIDDFGRLPKSAASWP